MGSCITKVDVDGFSMADMQDAIRLGGKPGVREATIIFKIENNLMRPRSHSSSSSLKMFLQPLPSCGRRYVPEHLGDKHLL